MLSDTMRYQLLATRSAIDSLLATDQQERTATSTVCTHPDKQRISRAAMGRPNAATCGICRATTEDGITWTTREGS
jgi:hypothetical protein